MAQLIVINHKPTVKQPTRVEQRFVLHKRLMTVGTADRHDVVVTASEPGLLFTLSKNNRDGRSVFEILPGDSRIRVNGQALNRLSTLESCDRIEWNGGLAVFLEAGIPASPETTDAGSAENGPRPLDVLQNLAATLQTPGALRAGLFQVLDALAEISNAEIGYLLSEVPGKGDWELLASTNRGEHPAGGVSPAPDKKALFSNTILQEALTRRAPVHVESIVGHPWSEAVSVIEARIFSAACIPLVVAERVFGAVFLFTRSPGKSIRKDTLGELSLLATQAALMLASQAELKMARRENDRLRRLVSPGPVPSKGDSPMADVESRILKLAPTDLSVLILGETGTGKEVVARELHRLSRRAKGPFVAVNCAAIPSTLLESTLFGHSKGAFTGATRDQLGKFSQANGGTLLLDEIGDLPIELQAKLLRVLQERQVEPIGAARPTPIDVRVLAATHQNLDDQVRAGRFRQDLFFRLNGAFLRLPPLRERASDIPALAAYFLEKARPEGTPVLSESAKAALRAHAWPGNVRELEQVLTRAALLAEGPEISEADLELAPSAATSNALSGTFWQEFANLAEAQQAFTRDFIQKTLAQCDGNRAEAAALLGVSERTLYRLLANLTEVAGRT